MSRGRVNHPVALEWQLSAKAYSYIRMSTDLQLKGDSLRRQREASRKYAEENNLDLIEGVSLQDIGVSAFQGKNISQGALGKFLAKVQAGEIDSGSFLLVESLDRLSRQSPRDATSAFLQILQAGINVVTLMDGHLYEAGKGDFAELIYSVVVMSRAHDESQTKSSRVSAAWSNKRRNAASNILTAMVPAWLSISLDRSSFIVNEDRASTVRHIFLEADQGKGSFQIARQLNQTSVPAFTVGKSWHESYVSRILTNRAVIGEFQPHRYSNNRRVPEGDPVANYFPAIVSTEQFERVRMGRLVRKNRGSGRKGIANTNLFSQVAKCGVCGGSVYLIDKGAKPKGGLYLRCDNARRGTNCTASNWPLAHFEQVFLTFVKELDVQAIINEPARIEEARTARARVSALEEELRGHELLRTRAFELLSIAETDPNFVQDKLSFYAARIKAIKAEVAQLKLELAVPVERKLMAANDMLELVSSISPLTQKSNDARVRIADWIRANVRELLLFSDGIDEIQDEPIKDKRRQFSVLFESGFFRMVESIGPDPANFSFAIHASGDNWIEETTALN